jgi:methionyl-tRNA formyltransferase
MEGEKETGVTIMLLDEGMDTGPILKQEVVSVAQDDTAGTLYNKLSLLGAELLKETLDEMEKNRITPVLQDDSLATYAPKVEKDEGRIGWALPAEKIHNLVRALNPAPGAFTFYGGTQLKVWATRARDGFEGAPAGTVLEAKRVLVVAAGSKALEVLEVQPANRDRMSGEEFARGYRIKAGDRLGG